MKKKTCKTTFTAQDEESLFKNVIKNFIFLDCFDILMLK